MNKLNRSDFKDYLNKVENEIEKILYRVLLILQRDAVDIIDMNKANATGEMRRNVRYEIYKEAAKMVGVVGIGSNVPYAIFRHEGTKPHWPPLLPIYNWVIRKGFVKIRSKPSTKGRLRALKKSEFERVDSEMRSIAFLIARKISKKGTTGLQFLRMSLNQNLNFITNEFSKLQAS